MISQPNCFISNSCNIPGGGMNYCLVATVTPLRLKNTTPRFEKWWFCGFILKNHPSDEKEERRRRVQEGEKTEKRKGGKRRRGTRQGLTGGDWQPCFSQFGSLLLLCFCGGSRNTSSAIHFISIPTPASHLHSVSFTSSVLFSACRYISWMITQWQFSLAVHGPGHSATCIQSCERGKSLLQTCRFLSLSLFFFTEILRPFTHSPTSPLRFPPATYPLNVLIKSRSLLRDPYETLHGSAAPPGTLVRITCLTSPRQQMSQPLDSYSD